MPTERAEQTPAGYSHGPSKAGPTAFKYEVRRRRKVIARTHDARSARLLAWALTMSELMRDNASNELLDLWVAWLSDLSIEERNGGRP